MGLVRLGEIAFDGTRVKACNGRSRTLTAKSLGKRLTALDAEITAIMDQISANEDTGGETMGRGKSTQLPEELQTLATRKEKLQDALELAKKLDAQPKKSTKSRPTQIPMTDQESWVMPNKEGGFAPNYTPTALTDGEYGIILDAAVVNVVKEHPEALPAVDRAIQVCGETPEKFLADAGNATGSILDALEQRAITAYVPAQSNEPAADSPILREDLSKPCGQGTRCVFATKSTRAIRQVVLRV